MDAQRRSRRFSLSISIPPALSRRQSTASNLATSATSSPSRIRKVIRRLSSTFRRRGSRDSQIVWPMFHNDYMYDDDIDISYEGLLSLAARIGDAKPRNLPLDIKQSLPRSYYCKGEQHDGSVAERLCPICLDQYQDNDHLLHLPECAHSFHADCLDKWLDLAANCPVCRNEIQLDTSQASSAPTSSPVTPYIESTTMSPIDEHRTLMLDPPSDFERTVSPSPTPSV